MRNFVVAILVAWFALQVATDSKSAEPAPPDEAPPNAAPPNLATPEHIVDWIRDLDAPEFALREAATAKLIQAGAAAIEPTTAALKGASREVTFRIVYVLRELALSADVDVEEAARAALEKLAQAQETVVGRRAEATLGALNQIRQSRTIEELERLGAKFDATRELAGVFLLPDVVSSVEIGPEWRGEEKDLRRLKWLANVQQVVFVGPRVTDAWIAHLAGMKQITSLTIKRATITDDGLEAVKDLSRLRFVALMYLPIGDGAADRLAQVKSIQLLRIFGTNVTVPAADRLKAALANAKIDYRRGGFLGVGGSQLSSVGCEIGRITEDSAAHKAGLQLKDLILRYDGQAVESFDKLTELIAVNRGGDTVTLDVARNAQVRPLRESHEAGAVLGITGKANVLGCELTEVAENSHAAKLGLQAGDVVVRYKGERLFEPARFRTLFNDGAATEEQELEFVRGAELLTAKATLGEWE